MTNWNKYFSVKFNNKFKNILKRIFEFCDANLNKLVLLLPKYNCFVRKLPNYSRSKKLFFTKLAVTLERHNVLRSHNVILKSVMVKQKAFNSKISTFTLVIIWPNGPVLAQKLTTYAFFSSKLFLIFLIEYAWKTVTNCRFGYNWIFPTRQTEKGKKRCL